MNSHFDLVPRRPRATAITRADFARLHTTPFASDGHLHYGALLTAALPAVGILAVAVSLLLAIL
jgi:hypothetical protein